MDPSAKVPRTAEDVLAQVTSSGNQGDIFFSSSKKYDQANPLLLKTPLGNQVNYSTGQGDAGEGSNYTEQGRVVVAIVGAQDNIKSYGMMFISVVVGWSTPGAPNATNGTVLDYNPTKRGVWTRPLDQLDIVSLVWTSAPADDYYELVVQAPRAYYMYPVASQFRAGTAPAFETIITDSDITRTTNIYWTTSKTEIPTTDATGRQITVTKRAWDPENEAWKDDDSFGSPVYLTSKVVIEREVESALQRIITKLTNEMPTKINLAVANGRHSGDDIEPFEVKIVEQPVDVVIKEQPIKVELIDQPIDVNVVNTPLDTNVLNNVNVGIVEPLDDGAVITTEKTGTTDKILKAVEAVEVLAILADHK